METTTTTTTTDREALANLIWAAQTLAADIAATITDPIYAETAAHEAEMLVETLRLHAHNLDLEAKA